MKFIIALFIALFAISFFSCEPQTSKEAAKEQNRNTNTNAQAKYPAHIAENQSIVTAEVEGVYVKDETDFFIKARILNIENDPAYLSLAIKGAGYILVPSFQMHNDKVKDSSVNKGLESLTKLKVGDTFKAIIFYRQYYGWYIEKVL